jgi:hypothetical protein
MTIAILLLVGLGCYLLAALGWFVLDWRNPGRAIAFGSMAVIVAIAPWSLPESPRLPRLLATIGAAALLVKLYDLSHGSPLQPRPSPRAYLLWLGNIFSLVFRKQPPLASRSTAHEAYRLLMTSGFAAVGVAMIVLTWFSSHWVGAGYWLEHIAKVSLLFATLWAASAAAAAAMRMLGCPAMDLMIAPVLSRTPADFWRRYNRPVGQFLHEYVFLPARGLSRPSAAILLAFLVSGLAHEYGFLVPIGRLCGYQTLFFLVQGIAVVLTARWRPGGGLAVLSALATLAFMLISSTLFFASLDAVTPFYVSPVPLWLSCGQ